MDILLLAVGAALVNNVILSQFWVRLLSLL